MEYERNLTRPEQITQHPSFDNLKPTRANPPPSETMNHKGTIPESPAFCVEIAASRKWTECGSKVDPTAHARTMVDKLADGDAAMQPGQLVELWPFFRDAK